MRGEFELIARHFAPLAAGTEGAFGLLDDAAVIPPLPGRDLVYTSDTIASGVHYLPDDPADDVARKLLRVNLSDLAAMGARPEGYLLNTAFQPDVQEDWIAGFAAGLAGDQDSYSVRLWGGDTTRTRGATVLSLTAVGSVPHGRCLRRTGARAGDNIYVSGTIGDAAFGLKASLGELSEALDEPAVAAPRPWGSGFSAGHWMQPTRWRSSCAGATGCRTHRWRWVWACVVWRPRRSTSPTAWLPISPICVPPPA
jgi:thiamine-monophosphate kinase